MTEIQQGLLITAIGMGLVFAVIIFLWGLMALMMRLTSAKRKAPAGAPPTETDEPLAPEMAQTERQRRAVAAAVAVALAVEDPSRKPSRRDASHDGDSLSPWQAIHRARQLNQRNTRG